MAKKIRPDKVDVTEPPADAEDSDGMSLEEGSILDYITNEPIKDSPKEQVRQRIAHSVSRVRNLGRRHGPRLQDEG